MEHRLQTRLALRRLRALSRDVRLEDVEQDGDHLLREPRARREGLAGVVQRERLARAVLAREPPCDVLVEGAAQEERGGEQKWLIHSSPSPNTRTYSVVGSLLTYSASVDSPSFVLSSGNLTASRREKMRSRLFERFIPTR